MGRVRRGALVAVLLCLLQVSAVNGVEFVTYESVTVGATAVGLSVTTVNPPGRPPMRTCSGRLETAEVRFRFDFTDPTSTEGVLLSVGDTIDMQDAGVALAMRWIRTTATSGVLKVHCWR